MTTRSRHLVRRTAAVVAAVSLTVAGLATTSPASARIGATPVGAKAASPPNACPPSGIARSFSDALDKLTVDGATVGGLSSLAYDWRSHAWASTVDNHGTDPSRIWFFRDLTDPHVVRPPLVLRRPDGTAYTGATADNEGLALLPDGRFLVSSETEPSIRVFGRDGVQQAELPIPARFAVTGTAPGGQATLNATLEGLTISPDGRHVIAAMEGALSGDVSSTGDATLHRFLVYVNSSGTWKLQKQIAYQTAPGQRVPEIAAVGRHNLLVEEASYDPAVGNVIKLYAVPGYDWAPDVSGVPDLSTAPAWMVVDKRLVADLVRCPTLGATSPEPQANPLLDNFEGMAVAGVRRGPDGVERVRVSLISDDNFSPNQITRVLNVTLRLADWG